MNKEDEYPLSLWNLIDQSNQDVNQLSEIVNGFSPDEAIRMEAEFTEMSGRLNVEYPVLRMSDEKAFADSDESGTRVIKVDAEGNFTDMHQEEFWQQMGDGLGKYLWKHFVE